LARSVAAQDPQRDLEAASVAASDRNAELPLPTPVDLTDVETRGRHRPAATGGVRAMSRRAAQAGRWPGISRRALLKLFAPHP
jgi:hypothetical protein